jgi:hypothetical protein
LLGALSTTTRADASARRAAREAEQRFSPTEPALSRQGT